MSDSAGGAPGSEGKKGADPLERPADAKTIQAFYKAGLLSAEARAVAVSMLRPPIAWWRWVSGTSLFLGAALVVAGIVFFFAYNWAKMGAFLKFGLIEFLLIASVLGVWYLGIERILGKVVLMGAGVLVGALLAVYGQTYQTGADAFELFAAWSVFILGWVIVSRFAAMWLMWLILINVSVILYWEQVLIPNEAATFASKCVSLGLINSAALVAREFAVRRGLRWLAGKWFGWVILGAVLTYFSIPTVALIVDEYDRRFACALAAFLLAGGLGTAYWFYRYRSADLFALTLCALSVCVVVLTLIGRVLYEIAPETPAYLLFALVVLGVVSAAAFWLRRVGQAMKEESGA